MLELTTQENTEDAQFEEVFTNMEEQAKTISDTLAVNIAIQTERGANLLRPEEKLNVDTTKIPLKFVATEAIEFLSNQEFMKKTGETIKAEITEVVKKCKKKAEQKVKKSKVNNKRNKILERLAKQQAIIDEKKSKVKALRDERAIAKENFTEVNGFAQVQAIRDSWLVEKEASDAYISLQKKKESVQVINDRLELAVQNRDIKRTRINLIKARLVKLTLKLELNAGNKKAIKARMEKLKRKLAKKERKLNKIKIRIEKFRLRRERVRKLKVKNKFSSDLKLKKELDDEEAQLEIDITASEAEEIVVTQEKDDTIIEKDADDVTALAELQVIETEEQDDQLFEEIAEAEVDVVTEEESAVVAEKEAVDIQKELDEEEEAYQMDEDILDADDTLTLAASVNVVYTTQKTTYDTKVADYATREGELLQAFKDLNDAAEIADPAAQATATVAAEGVRDTAIAAMETLEDEIKDAEEIFVEVEYAKQEYDGR